MKNFGSKSRRDSINAYAPVFLWVGLIFFLSSSQASMSETSRFIGPLLRYLFPDISPETLRLVHVGVRKTAHFVEYSVLAFLVVRALTVVHQGAAYRFRFVFAFIAALLVATIDEFNQSFDPTRTGVVLDVVIDAVSAAAALGFLWLIDRPRRRDRLERGFQSPTFDDRPERS